MEPDTTPVRPRGTPVKMLRVEVVAGPSAALPPITGSDRVSVGSARGNDLELADPTVSRYHLELRREDDGILVIDHGSTNGTRAGPALVRGGSVTVPAGTLLELGESCLRVSDGKVEMVATGPEALGDLRGRSPAMRRVFATAERAAASEIPVLVVGESGTGKELVARAIHAHSARAQGPFVIVDCGAVTPGLFASELFGHEKGAFTGADRRHEGAFERARGGTLVLDEVGELPLELQAALLGVLERRTLRRIGGTSDVPVDVRIVAATNRDLRSAVNAGSFRLDLYYRIAVAVVALPPLRARRDDVALLVEHFLREAGYAAPVESVFPAAELERLARQDWPGNCRELRNVVLGRLALGASTDEGPLTASSPPGEATLDLPYREARAGVIDGFERRYLTRLLERTGGNMRLAAREARMDRTYLRELLRRHGLR